MRPNGRLALDLRERLSQGPLVWLSQLEVKKTSRIKNQLWLFGNGLLPIIYHPGYHYLKSRHILLDCFPHNLYICAPILMG